MVKKTVCIKPGTPTGSLVIAGVILFLIIGLLPSLAAAQGTASGQPQVVKVVPSQKSFSATLKAFRQEISNAGWSILNMHNMAGVLSERGYTLHPVVVLDVCSGKYSARVLSKDAYRPVSVFMPCRVSIYQTSQGKVFVAMMNTGAFLQQMPPEVAEVMSASDEEIGEVIARTVR